MESFTITIHDPSVKQVLPLTNCSDDYHFGKLDIKIADNIPLIMTEQYIHFTIDCSGSMEDICKDKRTKLDHLKFTLKNMLRWLVTNSVNVFVSVDAFDSSIHHIVPFNKLTKDNIESIIDAIYSIRADALTNIELALKNAKEKINAESIMNTNLTINEIFLTDGEATQGEDSSKKLLLLIDDNFNYTFVGFSDNHDDEMLTQLANCKNGDYRFIDAIEKSSLVYGEVLNKIFNLAFNNVTISIQGGEIYDYKTNSWSPTLYVGGLVGEELRTFHLRTMAPDLIKAELSGLDMNNNHVTYNCNLANYADINSYIFRQRVQELLFISKNEIHKIPNNYRVFRFNNDTNNTNNNKTAKEQIKQLLNQIKEYMATNNITDDKFLQLLCDDLYVAYKSYDYSYGRMYINARLTSQGAQQVYSANLNVDNNNDNLFDNINNYRTMSAKDSPYKTPKRAKIMRDVSSRTNAEDDI